MNRYFVYEGDILRAAQPKLHVAMKYFKKGRKIFRGTPEYHKTDLTKIVEKFLFMA